MALNPPRRKEQVASQPPAHRPYLVAFGVAAGFLCLLACDSDQLLASLPKLEDTAPLLSDWATPSEDDAPAFYSYVNDAGRVVYVSHPGLVPPGHRGTAEEVDVSRVSLNTELGDQLNEAIKEEHASLAATDVCQEARRDGEDDFVSHAVKRYPFWLVIGGVILLLLVTGPAIARQVGAGPWIRTLAWVIPLLLFLGVLTHTARQTQSTLSLLRSTSALCDAEALAQESSTAGRLGVVHKLRNQLLRIHRERQQKIDAIISESH